MTQSGPSLDYGVQKVCVPKTSDLRTPVTKRNSSTPMASGIEAASRGGGIGEIPPFLT